METPGIWLRTICRKNNLPVSDEQIGLLLKYVDHLLDWNRKINLISRQDEEFVWQNHILHSISLLFKLSPHHPSRIMDLGTGGGLPGIPLKILMPDCEFLLVDATRKKVLAVQETLRDLDLPGVEAMWGRAEELAKQENLLSRFDYIVARAVAPLQELISWSGPFLHPPRPPGEQRSDVQLAPPALIALKGGDLEEEIAVAKRGGRAYRIEVLDLVFPGSEEISSGGKKIVIVQF